MLTKQVVVNNHKTEMASPPCVCSDKSKIRNSHRGRKKLWDLQSRFHCCLIGTCLRLTELRRLCHKTNILESGMSDYDMHCNFVHIADKSSYPSRLLQKHLDKKYKRTIQQLRRSHSEKELQQRWHEAMKTGEVANAFWALVTHPSTSDELLDQLYGDMHMLSHLAGAPVRVDMQAFTQQQQQIKKLESQLLEVREKINRQTQNKEKTIQSLSKHLVRSQEAEQHLQKLEQQLLEFESGTKFLEMRNKIDELSNELNAAQRQKERAEKNMKKWKQMVIPSGDRSLKLEQSLAESRQECDALEILLRNFLAGGCQDNCTLQQDKTKPSPDLCNRCILYVGGRSSQKAHFRVLVEQYNGRFIHHDGGREDSRHHLSSILPRADAILCPLDCVSHDAVRRIKQFCNRHAKPLILLPNGSLSSFAKGLVKAAF